MLILRLFFLEKKSNAGILPLKCVYLLLQRLFYGVTCAETNKDTAKVTVCCDKDFSATSQYSYIHNRNLAAIEALQDLCVVENHFVERKKSADFPPNFATEIQRYE